MIMEVSKIENDNEKVNPIYVHNNYLVKVRYTYAIVYHQINKLRIQIIRSYIQLINYKLTFDVLNLFSRVTGLKFNVYIF